MGVAIRVVGVLESIIAVKVALHPGPAASLSQGHRETSKQPSSLTLTETVNLLPLVNLMFMSLDCVV